jgi:hypothetical protein
VSADNCIPFDRRPSTSARGALSTVDGRTGRGRRAPDHPRAAPPARASAAVSLADLFDHLTPAQYAFLSGVLAILADHGEEALTKSCEMVIERFGRGHAG